MISRLIRVFVVVFLIAFVWATGYLFMQITGGNYDHGIITTMFLPLITGFIPAVFILGFGIIITKAVYRFFTWLFTGKAKGSSIMDDLDASDRSIF